MTKTRIFCKRDQEGFKDMSRTIYEYKVSQIIDHTQIIRELYLDLTNQPEFKFKAGQFVMLHVPTETGKPALRAYSIATTEHDTQKFRLIFKFVENGVDELCSLGRIQITLIKGNLRNGILKKVIVWLYRFFQHINFLRDEFIFNIL